MVSLSMELRAGGTAERGCAAHDFATVSVSVSSVFMPSEDGTDGTGETGGVNSDLFHVF